MLPSKCHDVKVFPGDVLHFVTWGGGGWGDALQRSPELVALEVRRGLVSAEGARRYGVVVGADGALDAAGTEALRKELLAGRDAGAARVPADGTPPPYARACAGGTRSAHCGLPPRRSGAGRVPG